MGRNLPYLESEPLATQDKPGCFGIMLPFRGVRQPLSNKGPIWETTFKMFVIRHLCNKQYVYCSRLALLARALHIDRGSPTGNG